MLWIRSKFFNVFFSQLKRNEKDFSKFNALPKRTQEKILGKFLAGNVEARNAFEKNQVINDFKLKRNGIFFADNVTLIV